MATPEYKLLQLRQHLSGEPLKMVEPLGHSASAYEAAVALTQIRRRKAKISIASRGTGKYQISSSGKRGRHRKICRFIGRNCRKP